MRSRTLSGLSAGYGVAADEYPQNSTGITAAADRKRWRLRQTRLRPRSRPRSARTASSTSDYGSGYPSPANLELARDISTSTVFGGAATARWRFRTRRPVVTRKISISSAVPEIRLPLVLELQTGTGRQITNRTTGQGLVRPASARGLDVNRYAAPFVATSLNILADMHVRPDPQPTCAEGRIRSSAQRAALWARRTARRSRRRCASPPAAVFSNSQSTTFRGCRVAGATWNHPPSSPVSVDPDDVGEQNGREHALVDGECRAIWQQNHGSPIPARRRSANAALPATANRAAGMVAANAAAPRTEPPGRRALPKPERECGSRSDSTDIDLQQRLPQPRAMVGLALVLWYRP